MTVRSAASSSSSSIGGDAEGVGLALEGKVVARQVRPLVQLLKLCAAFLVETKTSRRLPERS